MQNNGILIEIILKPHQLTAQANHCIGLTAKADPSYLKVHYDSADKKTSLPVKEPLNSLFSGCLAEHLESVGLYDFYAYYPRTDHWTITCEVDDVLAAQTISVLFIQLTAGINTHIAISESAADGTFFPVIELPSSTCRTALNIALRLRVIEERDGVSLSFSADQLSPFLEKFPEWAQSSIPQHNRLLATAVCHALGDFIPENYISIASESNTVFIDLSTPSPQQCVKWVAKAKRIFGAE